MYPRFPLQVVLDYRNSLVEALEIELGRLMAALVKAQNTLNTLREKRLDLIDELRTSLSGELDLVKISQLRSNVELVGVYIERQEEEVQKLTLQVEEKRTELVKARQDEEVLVILKDKAIKAFQEEIKLKENRFQDDVYITNYFQKTQKGKL